MPQVAAEHGGACRGAQLGRLTSVWWLAAPVAGVALVAGLACSEVTAVVAVRAGYRRQIARVQLIVLYGLWRARWRLPRTGPHTAGWRDGGGRAAPARGRISRQLQPDRRPGAARSPVHHGSVARRLVPGYRPAQRRASGRSPLGAAVRYLQGPPRRVRVCRITLRARIGTGDPCSTALAAGAIHALLGAALGALGTLFHHAGRPPRVAVEPVYARQALDGSGSCILSSRLGHLMVAMAVAWWVSRYG